MFDRTVVAARSGHVMLTRAAIALLAVVGTVALMATIAPGAARAATPQALILGSSVSAGTATDGSGVSLEQQQAQADGFTVTVVDDPTWSAMTAAQFAAYQVIIIGDPTCGDTVSLGSVAQSNASVWEPVVMSSGGNKVLIGTDPTYHNDGPTGTQRGDLLEAKGIAFAGAVTGATGAYIDLSCTYGGSAPGTAAPILDGLSTHGAGSFTVTGVPCAGAISIVAQSGPTSGLHDADLSNWSCSVHEAFDMFPSDYTPLALATDPTVPQTYSATDVDTGSTVTGSPYIMVSGGGVTVKSNVTLTPPSQSLAAGGSASLVANVSLSGAPVVGGSVVFSVDSGPNVGKTFTGTTDPAGNTTFTYSDTGGAGTDSVSATYTDTHGVIQKATATVTWASATFGPPVATIKEPPNGAHFRKHQVVHSRYSCADAAGAPGIQSCTGPVPSGSVIDTSTSGPHMFAVTATSKDGQTATTTVTYIVNK